MRRLLILLAVAGPALLAPAAAARADSTHVCTFDAHGSFGWPVPGVAADLHPDSETSNWTMNGDVTCRIVEDGETREVTGTIESSWGGFDQAFCGSARFYGGLTIRHSDGQDGLSGYIDLALRGHEAFVTAWGNDGYARTSLGGAGRAVWDPEGDLDCVGPEVRRWRLTGQLAVHFPGPRWPGSGG